MLHTRLPGVPFAWPPRLRPWQLPQQPGVRDNPAGLSTGATAARDSSSGTGYPASLGTAFWAGMAAVAKWVRSPRGWVRAWGLTPWGLGGGTGGEVLSGGSLGLSEGRESHLGTGARWEGMNTA